MNKDSCCEHHSSSPAPGAIAIGTEFTCPMHPEVLSDKADDCPQCGMALEPLSLDREQLTDDTELRTMRRWFWWSVPLSVGVMVLAMGELIPGIEPRSWFGASAHAWLQAAMTTIVLFGCGRIIWTRAWNSVLNRAPNMWTLIGIGTLFAYLFSLFAIVAPDMLPINLRDGAHGPPLYFEAAAVIISLVLLGQVLELRARGQTSRALIELIDLAPSTARIVNEDGTETDVPIVDVVEHATIRIRPGERIPVDGEVIDGVSNLDESMLTGEALPQAKSPGSTLSAGTVNQTGSLLMRCTRVGADTLLAQIISLVASAQRSQAPIQRSADRVAAVFVPLVIIVAIVSFGLWLSFGPDPSWSYALVAAVSVLIIACPCALGLATPMSVMVGIGRGAREGILVRDAETLERLATVDVLVCDKTGTLTNGEPRIEHVEVFGELSADELLRVAACLELASEHPLAEAFVAASNERGLEIDAAPNFDSLTGLGVTGKVAQYRVAVGNAALMASLGVDVAPRLSLSEQHAANGASLAWIAVDEKLAGLFAIGDSVKPTSKRAIDALRADGVQTIMATGDHEQTARAIARQLDIEEVHAGMLPQDKYELVKTLQSKGRRVAMAGDGINDAPALAQADVGIAMGNGTDIAIESAAVTLVKGDLDGIVKALKLSRGTLRNIRQNLFFAFVYNGLGVPIAAGILYPVFGLLLSPMFAAAAMSMSSVSVIGNALRLRAFKL